MDYLLLLLLVEAGGDSAASIYAQQSDQLVPYSLSLSLSRTWSIHYSLSVIFFSIQY